eukprot:TRINITY_DN62952_c0_g1_i1.p1 TRINITY_DN62952_c0_g1~~TRINITY_DN62952_c0_g1_i1.p1  ORF type:complete len:295 (-),score=38.40 TRINITY_DN62952_c0_g1_i1:172-984(-)
MSALTIVRRLAARGPRGGVGGFGVVPWGGAAALRSPTLAVYSSARTCASGSSAAFESSRPLKYPSIEQAKALPRKMCELDNSTLILLAEEGDHDACFERLCREIMSVENLAWSEANAIANEIRNQNRKKVLLASGPNMAGVIVALTTGLGSIPLVFHKGSVAWFNDKFVLSEPPPAEEIVTMLEVGSWSWSWMEPVLGTASFTLLALQFGRAQLINMNIKPYTNYIREWRARRLVKIYPKYNANIVGDFARTSSLTPMVLRNFSRSSTAD